MIECREFQERIRKDESDSEIFCRHLNDCAACRRWLDEQNRTTPEGLGTVVVDLLDPALGKKVIPDSTGYFTEFIKRLVAALTILGAAVGIWLAASTTPRGREISVDYSFIEEENFSQVNFIEPLQNLVTSTAIDESKEWSFLESEKENQFSFLDEEEKEESS